jgi:hypothetical protein
VSVAGGPVSSQPWEWEFAVILIIIVRFIAGFIVVIILFVASVFNDVVSACLFSSGDSTGLIGLLVIDGFSWIVVVVKCGDFFI